MVTLDTLFELLENERRRYVLYYLYEQDGPVGIKELIKTIEDWEDNPPTEDRSLGKFEEIAFDLKHHQLPKSDGVEFIQYDPEQGVIQIQGSPPKLDTFVSIARVMKSRQVRFC